MSATEPRTATPPGRAAAGGRERRTVGLGLLGSVLVALGGVGSGAVRVQDPLLDSAGLTWWREGAGYVAASAFAYVGLGVLLLAWVLLGRAVLAGTTGASGVRWAVGAWLLPLLAAPPLFSRDVYSYLAQGALLRDGFDPYAVGPAVNPGPLLAEVSAVWVDTPAPYGPVFLGLAETVTRLTGDDVVAGTVVLRLVMLPGVALLVWALPRLAAQLGGSGPVALWLAVANPVVLVHLVGGAHNEMLMVGLLAAGTTLLLGGRHLGGVALIALAGAVKATALLALPFLVWVWMDHLRARAREQGRPAPGPVAAFARTAGPGAAVVVAVFAGASLLVGVGVGWLTALAGSSRIVNWLSVPTILGHVVTVGSRGTLDLTLAQVLPVTRVVCGVVLALVLVALWWRTRADAAAAVRAVPVALLAVVVLSPAALPWYFAWPLSLAAGLRLPRTGLAALAGLSAWLVLVFRPDGGPGLYTVFDVAVASVAGVAVFAALRRPAVAA